MADRPKDLLAEMRQRYDRACEYWADGYQKAVDDIKFVTVPGHQWNDDLKRRRKNRHCYEFPKLRMLAQQIINEQKQSRPQGKVRGTEDSDRALAELMQGICRNIEASSNAEYAYDIAFEQSVRGGLGFVEVTTDYAHQDDFDLDIRIKPVRNFAAVKLDPAAVEPDRRDAHFAFVEDRMSEAEFKRRFPKADHNGFQSSEECSKFRDAGQVCVLKYWWKEPEKRELWQLSSGAVTYADEAGVSEDDLAAMGVQIVRRREVESHKVKCALTNGHEFLTDPVEFPSKFIPIVPCWGFLDLVDGVEHFAGVIRFNRDSQRLHNVHKTAAIEAVAKAPKAPFIAKPSQIRGFEEQWKNANSEDYPVLFISEEAQGVPQRAQQAELPVALLQLASLDNEDMRAQTGQYAANLGAPSNESSGRAIGLRRAQGATATYNYLDGLSQCIRYVYEILGDMIPRVYDTPRVVRVLGPDGGEKFKQLYQEVQDPLTGEVRVLNDISKGKYDYTVTIGPSYATQRMEAADAFTQLAGQIGGSMPGLGPLLSYQAIKALDLPGSEEVDKSLRKMLVAQGLLEPQEGEEPPQPAGPPPELLAKQAEMQQTAQLKQMELEHQTAMKRMELEAQAEFRRMDAEARIIAEQAKQDGENARLAYRAKFDAMLKESEIEAERLLAAAELEAKVALEQAQAERQAQTEAARFMAQQGAANQQAAQMGDALSSLRDAVTRMNAPRRVIRDDAGNMIGVQSE